MGWSELPTQIVFRRVATVRTEPYQCEQPRNFGTTSLVRCGTVGMCSHAILLLDRTVPYRAVPSLRAGVNGVLGFSSLIIYMAGLLSWCHGRYDKQITIISSSLHNKIRGILLWLCSEAHYLIQGRFSTWPTQ